MFKTNDEPLMEILLRGDPSPNIKTIQENTDRFPNLGKKWKWTKRWFTYSIKSLQKAQNLGMIQPLIFE